ncbi:MAG: hypothetical protein QCH99_08260 [Candidatus Bathyarchaeota archaeon]|nr:hypothetical protein [Candidatus Bathyarchaeum tardum]
MVSNSSSRWKVFAVLNAALGALIVSFLTETLILRIIYSSLFFFILYFLQNIIFEVDVAKKDDKCNDGTEFQSNRTCRAMFFLGFLASIAVVVIPVPLAIANEQFSVIFLGLPWWAFIRILLGLFLLSIFPGYVLYNNFLSKFNFDMIETIGLTFALSFSVNTLLGLTLLKFDGLSLANILISMWLFVAIVTLTKIVISKRTTASVQPQPSQSPGRMVYFLLCLIFLVMLFSSYAIILSSDVADPALGGDINRYIAASVSITRGETPLYLSLYALLLVFTSLAHYLTGLHIFASYICLEFLVLLVPTSSYFLFKSLFPRDRKAPVIGAIFISITAGFSSLGIFDFLTNYTMGEQSTFLALNALNSKTALSAFAYQYYVTPLVYSILFLALAFAYRYSCRGRRLSDLLLCGLFAVVPLFTHSIFEFSCILVTLLVFSLFSSVKMFSSVKTAIKTFLIICLSILLFFIPFEVTTGVYSYTIINHSFHFTSVFGYSGLIDFKLPLMAFSTLVLLFILFRKRIACLSSVAYRKAISFLDRRLSKMMLWVIATVFLLLKIYFWRSNWMNTNIYAVEWLPWYVVILLYGFAPYLIIVTLPYILKKADHRNVLFMFSWLLTVFLLSSLSLLNSSVFPTAVWGRRWLYFASYPLLGLAAIGLSSMHFTLPSARAILLKFSAVKIRFNLDKLRYIPPILLIFAISFSFLSYVYHVEFFYTGTYTKNISDPEAETYNWILNNTPENAVFLTLTDESSVRMESLACRKSFGYSDAAASWPLQALFNSRLPEALLYSLKELDVSYIFVTPRDTSFIVKNFQDSYLNSLLNVLPVGYERDNITLYAVPKYPLYEDSNYVLVSPSIDFQNISSARASLAFHDDFSANLTDWMTISGDWAVENEELYASGKGAVNNWCQIVSNQSFSNFIYEYKSRSMRSTGLQYIWGIFRFLDENNFYSFYVGNTTYEVYECVNGIRSRISGGALGITLNLTQWTNVTIEATYSTIKLYINDNLIKTMQGTGREGKIGLSAYAGYHTVYDDVKVTSLTLPVDSKSALLGYQVASNMLVASGVNFTIVPDVNLTRLEAGNMYIFPYNWHIPQNLVSNLQEYVSQGAHVIFLDSLFGSFDELDAVQSSVLSSVLQVKLGAASTYSDISFEDKTINLTANCNVNNLIYSNNSALRILSNYTSENQATPYIIQKQLGIGTLSFIHITGLLDSTMSSVVLRGDLLKNSLHEVMKSLPKPVETKIELTIPFPHGFYKFTRCNDIPTLLSHTDLYDYIYVYGSSIVLNGSCIAESNYALMAMEQIIIEELEISNATQQYYIANESLSYLSLKGSVNLSLKTDYLTFSPSNGDSLITFSTSTSITIQVDLIDAELHIKTDNTDSKKLSFTKGNCTIVIPNAESNLFKIALNQPIIELDGSLNLKEWQGIFWYGDKAVTGFVSGSNSCVINGNLSLQPMYSFGGVQIKVEDVQYIKNVER